MPFTNPETARAYRMGYQVGYRQRASLRSTARLRRQLEEQHGEAEQWPTILRGFEAGLSNRQGETLRARQARWYQKNRRRLVRRKTQMRRQSRAEEAMATLRKVAQRL